MINRLNVWLNGVSLSSLCSDLAILDIRYDAPRIQNNTVKMAKGNGARLIDRYIEKSVVSVDFELHIYSPILRQEALDRIVGWAMQGGVLQTSDKSGKRLRCVCETPPVITSATQWTGRLTMAFASYSLPFWEECYPVTLTMSGTNTSGQLYVPGNAGDAHVYATINSPNTLTNVVLIAGDTEFQLLDFSVPAGNNIEVYYDYDMLLHIEANNASLRDKRTSVSSDKLLAACGKINTFCFRANASATCTFNVWGVWI